jgi:hypothetical protein
MTASSSDTKLFHYQLRRQRSVDIQHTRILQYNDQVAETHEDILALWQKYFQDLSNPDFKQDFIIFSLCNISGFNSSIAFL